MIYPIHDCLKCHSVFEVKGVPVVAKLKLVEVIANSLTIKLHFLFKSTWYTWIYSWMPDESVRSVLNTCCVFCIYLLRVIVERLRTHVWQIILFCVV